MYIMLALVMLLRGFVDAAMMRSQQAVAFNSDGYLPPSHFDQIFSSHGTIMIFFMAMPFMTGLINIIVPLQIGTRDVAFPWLNAVSLWLSAAGAALVMVSLVIGKFSTAGWTGYPPYSGIEYNPGVGVDYWIWAILISGVGSTLSGINFIVTILKRRAPGMTLMRMTPFVWTALVASVLMAFAFPAITVACGLLALDRLAGMHFFTNAHGGNMMNYVNLFWIWGHPEVYILVLPAFGIFSEVVATFSGKRLFGYASMVYATCVIMILSYIVWLHHFFTMGSGASVNSFFGITTMIISIPTGAKIFNWLFTMYRGQIRFELPMMWVVAFMLTFVVGGMTGVLLAVPPADFVLHNSLFLVAHFHNVIIGGVVFGLFAGMDYWFPKAFGFKLDRFWGKVTFWGWVIGYWVAWTPIYIVGLMGTTRRVNHFDDPSLQIWFVIAAIGALIILVGIVGFVIQIAVSIINRDKLRDTTGDPWNGRTLEWSTSSPPPAYNFAFVPQVHDLDAWYDMKDRGAERPTGGFRPIHMPRNTGAGVILSGLALALGFGMIWYMWWLAAVAAVGLLAVGILHTFNYNRDYFIPAEEVSQSEDARTRLLAAGA
jgi:cytochrome o ubiquinol oxidase subunit 1